MAFSNTAETYPGYVFKIADLGLSHLKANELGQTEVLDFDSYGTYAYGGLLSSP